MKRLVTVICTFILLTGISLTGISVSVCQGQTAYVSDQLILTFREGPGTQHAVIKTLKSDTPLNILEEDNGFYKVSLNSGEQGWVDKKFIMLEPPKTLIIERLNREKSALKTQIQKLKQTSDERRKDNLVRETGTQEVVVDLTRQVADLEQKTSQLTRDLKDATTKLNTLKQASRNVTGILNENKQLKTENAALSKDIEDLENETRGMFKTGMIKWFLAGFGILLFGWIIGKTVSPKRQSGGSLLD